MGVGEGGWVVSAPHATRSRVDSRAPPHAVRAIARGAWAPARRVDAPLRCAGPQGPHRLVRWCGGVVRRGVSVGAEQARSARLSRRRRQGRRSGASTVWCAGHACACGHHARIRLRDGRGCWWRVSTKSASPHRSPVCTDVDGEEAAGSHAWAAWSACSRRARFATPSSGVLAFGGKSSGRSDINAGPAGGLGGFLGARRGVAGDVPCPWLGHRQARITQRPRVGELEPKTVFFEQGVKKTSGHVVGLSKVSGWIL